MSTQSGKEVIYIDIDDEITAIIDKVRGSHERIVALVLPKRATVFQSIVNMKLLKRTADAAKKHLVLITSEAGLLPLAGSVGIYVAKTLQTKPEVPDSPAMQHDNSEDIEETVSMADEGSRLDNSRPVAEHARHAPASVVQPDAADDDQPIELDNTAHTGAVVGGATPSPKGKGKAGKKFNIPDFNKFRTWIIAGGAAIVLLVFLLWMGLSVMPRATVLVKTDSTALQESIDVTFNTESSELIVDSGIVPAVSKSTQKTFTQQADATGQKDKGKKASGSVTIRNCSDEEVSVPAGTAVTANNMTFITQDGLDLGSGNFNGAGACKLNGGHVSDVDVEAQQNGAQYNLGPRSDYKVAGQPSLSGYDDKGMSGGTSEIVKVLTQADIDNAKQKISSQNTDNVKSQLVQELTADGLYAVEGTYKAGDPQITTSANVGDEVNNVSVTEKLSYTMVGAKQSDLKKLIDAALSEKIDAAKQKIIDYGLDGANFKLMNQQGSDTLTSMDVTVIAGSDIDLAEIKKQIAGKKSNDAKAIIGKYPGVTNVDVTYSPFWVSSIPKKAGKITITVQKPVVRDADN